MLEIIEMNVEYRNKNGMVKMRAKTDYDDGGEMAIHVTDAFIRIETGNEINEVIQDFMRRVKLTEKAEPVKIQQKAEPKPRRSRSMFDEQQNAEIIRRYQAGEGPKSIGESYGVVRNKIQQIIHAAGVTEGRTGKHLKKKQEPQPEAEKTEPV